MSSDWARAREILDSGTYTCVLVGDGSVHTSTERGVKPLLAWLDCGASFARFSAADKVVGKAAAFLYVLLGVSRVYARVMSAPAVEVLRTHGIEFHADVVADAIINRAGTGLCPMETAVRDMDAPSDAYRAIVDTLRALERR